MSENRDRCRTLDVGWCTNHSDISCLGETIRAERGLGLSVLEAFAGCKSAESD